MTYLYSTELAIDESPSRDSTLARIRYLSDFGDVTSKAARILIEETDSSSPLLFAGQHKGMPQNEVWAFTRNPEVGIVDHIDNISNFALAALNKARGKS